MSKRQVSDTEMPSARAEAVPTARIRAANRKRIEGAPRSDSSDGEPSAFPAPRPASMARRGATLLPRRDLPGDAGLRVHRPLAREHGGLRRDGEFAARGEGNGAAAV